MNCFYHPTAEAVSNCSNCGEWLCQECAMQTDNGIVCRNGCHAAPKPKTISASDKRNLWISMIAFLVIGAIFVFIGARDYETYGVFVWLGGPFILFAGSIIVLSPVLRNRQ
jgi:hypothetical protein